jgi:subtilisin family serine protease
MKTIARVAVPAFLGAALAGPCAAAGLPRSVPGAPVPGHVLVKPAPGVSASRLASLHREFGATVLREYRSFGWQLVSVPDADVAPVAAAYAARPEIEAAEPDTTVAIEAGPNDPSYSALYGLARIGAPTAWGTTVGSPNIVVAVLDTGIFYNHEDLAANMWRNPGEIAGNGVDDDANGYVDDVYGYDFANKDPDPVDDHSHGTHCAGIIGAVGNNGIGVVGVNWSVRLMALKFMKPIPGGSALGNISDAVAAYQYAIDMRARGVNVRAINNSWGGGPYSQAMKDAIEAAGNAGILSLCAAGNGDEQGVPINTDLEPHYPSCYNSNSIISVAASTASDAPAYFSNYGLTSVDLAAPGASILSTINSVSGYASYDGTSMAAPHVAGAAALLWSAVPDLTVAQVKSALMGGVDPVTAWAGKTVTGGRLNVARAMATVVGAGSAHLEWQSQPAVAQTRQAFATAPAVRVLDAGGNLVTTFNGTVSLAIKPGTGSAGALLNGPTIAPAVNGVATFPGVSISKPGFGFVLTASTPFAGSIEGTPFDVVSTASKLEFRTHPGSVTTGQPLNPQPVVAAVDDWGNAVPTFTGEVSLAIKPGTGAPGAVLEGTTTSSAVAGVASFSGLSIAAVGNNYVLTASSGSLTGDSAAFNIASVVTQLAFDTQPGTGQAGVPLPRQPVVQARDASNAWAYSFTGPVAVALKEGTGSPGAVLLGTTTVNASSGMAYFGSLAVDRPGAGYVLTATADGLPVAESAPFDVSPKATRLAFSTQPVGGLRGEPLATQPVVQARDDAGALAFGFNGFVTVAIKPGTGTPGATLGGATTIPLQNGVASFTGLAVSRGGEGFVLTASGGGLATGDSAPFAVLPGVIRVSTAGDDARPGDTWATAMRSVQAAVNAAPPGDEVWVAAGAYIGALTLKPGVSLYGGFAGTETLRAGRAPWMNATVLDGGGAGPVVTFPAGATPATVLDGFTVRNGGAAFGAGIFADGASPTINGNIIRDNSASAFGGGLYLSGNAVVRNNLFRGNSANIGGAVYAQGGAPVFAGNTVADNTAAMDGGGLAFNDSEAVVANNIVAFNSSGVYVEPFTSNLPAFIANDVHGNAAYAFYDADPAGADGNIAADPAFADRAAGDYRLAAGSPCIDAGNDAYAVSGGLDLTGTARVQGAHVDIGACETATVLPFGVNDVAAALRIAAGLAEASDADARYAVVSGGAGISVADAALLARKVSGLESNP